METHRPPFLMGPVCNSAYITYTEINTVKLFVVYGKRLGFPSINFWPNQKVI